MFKSEEAKPGFSSGGRPNLTPGELTAHLDAIRRAVNQNTAALRALTRALSRRGADDDLVA